jgi:hypothetical protein
MLLTYALKQHPDVKMFIECLAPGPERRFYDVDGRLYRDDEDGATFVREVLFPAGSGHAAVGFKFMYHHGRQPPALSAREMLSADRDVHVIHLYREDLLACLVSLDVATRSNVWHVAAGSDDRPAEVEPFPMPKVRCERYFRHMTEQQSEARTVFADHPFLELEYQRDLVDDYEDAMQRVWRFLGLPAMPTTPWLVKTATKSPSEQLSNFDELASSFAGRPEARYFSR